MAIYQLYLLLMMASVYFVVCSEKTFSTTEPLANYGGKVLCQQPKLPVKLMQMQRGIDLTKLNLFRKHDENHDNGFRDQVIQFTCNEGKTWKHQEVSTIYDIPDDVEAIDGITTSELFLTYSVFKNTDEYKTNIRAQSDASADVDQVGSFSRSYAFEYANKKISIEKKTITEIKGFASASDVSLKPPEKLNLDPEFVEAYQKLKGLTYSFDTYRNTFYPFLEKYGTHYFVNVEYGGKVLQHIEVNSKFTSENNAEELYLNSGASLKTFMKIKNELNASHSHMTESFQENTIIEFDFFGGMMSSGSNLLVDTEWIRSVFKSPQIVKGNLKPISDLIPDPKISHEVLKSIVVYSLRASIFDLLEVILTTTTPDFRWHSLYIYDMVKINSSFFEIASEYTTLIIGNGEYSNHMGLFNKPENLKKELNALIDRNSVCGEYQLIVAFIISRRNVCYDECVWHACCPQMISDEIAFTNLNDEVSNKACNLENHSPEESEHVKQLLHDFKKNHVIGAKRKCCTFGMQQ